jgi:hypothetical protein
LERLAYGYELAFARAPTEQEWSAIKRFWSQFPQQAARGKSTQVARDQSQVAALSAFCQSLIASAEFRYLN